MAIAGGNVADASCGAKAPLEQVVRREIPTLYRVARRLAGNPQEAEDLVAQTLLKAAQTWRSFDGRFPRSWMIRILRNEFLGALRKRDTRPKSVPLVEAHASCQNVAAEVETRLTLEELEVALMELPEEYCWAVMLCDVEALSYDEAAEIMEVPIGTVRSRLHRGRDMLRKKVLGRLQEIPEEAML